MCKNTNNRQQACSHDAQFCSHGAQTTFFLYYSHFTGFFSFGNMKFLYK